MIDMILTDKYGYYHATNEGGYISWYDFTKEIFRQAVELGHTEYAEDKVTVLPVTTAEYGVSKAARPFNSRLDKKKLVENGFTPLPTWQDALARYLKEIEFLIHKTKRSQFQNQLTAFSFISQNPEALLTPGFHSFYLLSSVFLSDIPKMVFTYLFF